MGISEHILALRRLNWWMTAMVLSLVVIGIFFVYSSCYVDEGHAAGPYRRQIIWACVGLLAYLGMALVDYRILARLSIWFYLASLFLLVLVLLVGTKIYGARRWLSFLGVSIQPSEIAKLATIIVMARLLGDPSRNAASGWTFVLLCGILAVPTFLIAKEPDLGTAAVLAPIGLIMMFIGGVSWRFLAFCGVLGLVVMLLVVGALFLPERFGASEDTQERIAGMTLLRSHQRTRIVTFFRPDTDPQGAGWNKEQSEIAVGSGGMWGKGFKQGDQNILGFLPRSVAPTDFIYSVVAEEKGFVGSVAVLALFGAVLVGGAHAALSARDALGRLLCVGAMAMVFCHVFINIAMTIGVLPITGLPLPLLSYGGSFMVVTMSALGIVQSVYVRSFPVTQISLS